jgi:hypothetical protein
LDINPDDIEEWLGSLTLRRDTAASASRKSAWVTSLRSVYSQRSSEVAHAWPTGRAWGARQQPRAIETNEPAPGQNPEGGINWEMKELFDKAANYLGTAFGPNSRPPWGDVTVPVFLLPGSQAELCYLYPSNCASSGVVYY